MNIAEDASNGSTTDHQSMLLADDIAAAKIDQKSGEAEAADLIRRESGT